MTSRPTTALVIVSHSVQLAQGVVELAAQMAPEVVLRAAGGTDDGGIGTSFDKLMTVLRELPEHVTGAVVLTDIGSATMTAEAVLESLDDDARVLLADAPLVEGAVAAAVTAELGGDPAAVQYAAEEAVLSFGAIPSAPATPSGGGNDGVVERVVELRNELGLHARAAAMLADVISGFDAHVEVNGVDGTSALALTGLGLTGGGLMQLRASGPQAEHVLDAVGRVVGDRFGEE